MKPVKCRRCGEVFQWALDLAAHTDTCPMPPVSHLDGPEGGSAGEWSPTGSPSPKEVMKDGDAE